VEFEPGANKRGPCAFNVRLLDEPIEDEPLEDEIKSFSQTNGRHA
jgi:hypothetical protein